MSSQAPSPSERRNRTLGLVLLASLLGLGLATALRREFQPTPPPGGMPATRSRLMAVLEGVMAVNTTSAERARFKHWVEGGATREGFAEVAPIVANNCASCHDQGGQYPRIAAFDDLQPIALEPAPTGLGAMITPRGLHLLAIPLLFLVAVFGFLRPVAPTTWRAPATGALFAVLLDAGQWLWRQGTPGHAWLAGLGAAALALAMAAVVGRVLGALWGERA